MNSFDEYLHSYCFENNLLTNEPSNFLTTAWQEFFSLYFPKFKNFYLI